MRYRRLVVLNIFLLLSFGAILPVSALDSSSVVENALEDPVVVVVYFRDSLCTDCDISDDIMAELDDDYGSSVRIINLNLDYGEGTLVNLYDIEILPTVVIYHELSSRLTDHPLFIIEGLKTHDYYVDKIDEALAYDDYLESAATTYFDLATSYFELENYDTAKYYFQNAIEMYDELGDVYNFIICDQYMLKCDKYSEANEILIEADQLYEDKSYLSAKSKYSLALSNYELLEDEEKITYCTEQMTKCDLYPSLATSFQEAKDLVNTGNYSSALSLLNSLKEDYLDLNETSKADEVESLIEKCEDYLLAGQYFSEATDSLNENNYTDAISSFEQAKYIYSNYNDTEKISLCNQNIAIAQQFIDLQTTPPPTTAPPSSGSGFEFDSQYLMYFGGAAAVIFFIGAIYLYSRSRGNDTPVSDMTAMEKLSQRTWEEEKSEKPETIDTQKSTDYFITFQDKAFKSKNELLALFVQWVDDFLIDIEKAEKEDYFTFRERFDEIYDFFTRSFTSDEVYLDLDLYDGALKRLHQIQQYLNDLMDVV